MRDSKVPFERILAAIPPGTRKDQEYAAAGSGRDYAYDYAEIEEARRVVEVIELRGDGHDAKRQGNQLEPKPAQWDQVFALGVKVLATESKDLLVAAWVVEALGHLRGFAGLRDGFAMFRRLQGRYPNSSYPRSDRDPAVRGRPYEFLDNQRNLPLLIKGLPITFPLGRVPLSSLRRQEAERNESEAMKIAKASPRGESEAQAWLNGKLRLKDWKSAIEDTPPATTQELAGEVAECLISFKAWETSTDRLFRGQKHGPSLTLVGKALLDCARQVRMMLPDADSRGTASLELAMLRFDGGRRPIAIPPVAVAIPEVEAAPNPPTEIVPEPPPASAAPSAEPRPETGPEPVVISNSQPVTPAAREPEAPPEDAETAYRRVREAAAFLRGVDPSDPVPYLLIRSLQLGGIYGQESVEPHPGPARETRKELRQLAAAGAWNDLVELTEEVLSRPEGRGWLDAHRLAIWGLQETGRDRAAGACLGLLMTLLGRDPALPDAELDDGTAAASAETRAWLASLPGPAASPTKPSTKIVIDRVPASAGSDEATRTAEPEPDALLRDGRVDEAVQMFSNVLDAAPSDRDRHLATVKFARACCELGLDRLALPLLEGLESRQDEAVLRSWEGRDFFAGVATMLHDALIRAGGAASAERVARSRARLFQVAPAEVLRRQSGRSPD